MKNAFYFFFLLESLEKKKFRKMTPTHFPLAACCAYSYPATLPPIVFYDNFFFFLHSQYQ